MWGPEVETVGGWPRLSSLNRIKSAATVVTSGQNCWGQLFGHMNGGTYVSGYDPWANLKEISVSQCSAPMLSLSVDASNHVTGTGYGYDAAGNMTADGLGHSPAYDAENRIKNVGGVNYTYDGDGKRVKKDTGKLYWTGTGSDPLAESDLSGTINEEYVFFSGKRIARLDLPSGTVHYYFADHLGSASVVTNADGTTTQDESDYFPFGGERILTNSDPNQYKFTGKERDAETGLDYFGARYYGSNLGRWLTPDWSGDPEPVPYADFNDPQTLNLYGYVRNNPLSRIDSDGHGCEVDGEKHNWAWCAAHKLGWKQTKKERHEAAQARRRELTALKVQLRDPQGKLYTPDWNKTTDEDIMKPGGMYDRIKLALEMGLFAVGGVRFGNNPDQERHAFRHVEEAGIDKTAAEDAIRNDLAGKERALPQGLTKGQVTVAGKTLEYHAYKMPDGTINVGRITVR